VANAIPERYERAAARWHARFVLEAPGIGLTESLVALSAVQALRDPQNELAARTLLQLADNHGLSAVAAVLRRRGGS
jgi:hypothetical protein